MSEEDDDSKIGGDLEEGEFEMDEDEIAELEAEQMRTMNEMDMADSSDDDDVKPVLGKRGRSEAPADKKGKGVSVSYEYEFEEENEQPQKVKADKVLSSKRRASTKSTAHSSGGGSVDF